MWEGWGPTGKPPPHRGSGEAWAQCAGSQACFWKHHHHHHCLSVPGRWLPPSLTHGPSQPMVTSPTLRSSTKSSMTGQETPALPHPSAPIHGSRVSSMSHQPHGDPQVTATPSAQTTEHSHAEETEAGRQLLSRKKLQQLNWLRTRPPTTGGVGGNRKMGVPLFADGKGKSQVSLPRVTGRGMGWTPKPGAESADPAGGAPGERRACPQALTQSNSLQPLP